MQMRRFDGEVGTAKNADQHRPKKCIVLGLGSQPERLKGEW